MCMVNAMKRRIDELEARLASITERLTRLSLGADAVIKADQSGTAGDKSNAMGQLIGALYRAKDEVPGVRGAIEEVERLKAQNARLRGALEYSDTYLKASQLNSIGHGSKAHREMSDALSESAAQSLAEIEARAVEAILKDLRSDMPPTNTALRFFNRLQLRVDVLRHTHRVQSRSGYGYDREVLGQNNEEGAA